MIVQATKRARLRRERMIVLHKVKGQPGVFHALLVPAFGKEATVIAVAGGFHDENTSKGCFRYNHHFSEYQYA